MKNRGGLFLAFTLVVLTFLVIGCGRDVKIVYNFDPFGLVETAYAYRGESLIAKAERVGMSPNEFMGLDIHVLETHFSQKTGKIVYKGRMIFRCKPNEEYGKRVEVKPEFGKRPRDLFRVWPYAVSHPMGFPF